MLERSYECNKKRVKIYLELFGESCIMSQNLVKDMRSQAPKVADTRWESMSHVSACFKLHRIAVNNYFEVKTPSCSPSPCW